MLLRKWKVVVVLLVAVSMASVAEEKAETEHVVETPESASPSIVEKALSRQDALIEGLQGAALSDGALAKIIEIAQTNPNASPEQFAKLVDAMDKEALSDEQKGKLKELFKTELGPVSAARAMELARAGKLVRSMAQKKQSPPATAQAKAPAPQPSPAGSDELMSRLSQGVTDTLTKQLQPFVDRAKVAIRDQAQTEPSSDLAKSLLEQVAQLGKDLRRDRDRESDRPFAPAPSEERSSRREHDTPSRQDNSKKAEDRDSAKNGQPAVPAQRQVPFNGNMFGNNGNKNSDEKEEKKGESKEIFKAGELSADKADSEGSEEDADKDSASKVPAKFAESEPSKGLEEEPRKGAIPNLAPFPSGGSAGIDAGGASQAPQGGNGGFGNGVNAAQNSPAGSGGSNFFSGFGGEEYPPQGLGSGGSGFSYAKNLQWGEALGGGSPPPDVVVDTSLPPGKRAFQGEESVDQTPGNRNSRASIFKEMEDAKKRIDLKSLLL